MKTEFEMWRIVPAILGCVAFGAVGCGGPVETGEAVADTDIGSITAALGGPCQINANLSATCDATGIPLVNGRKVYYRVGANSGPGYDAVTGRHSAVVLFQGTGFGPLFGDNGMDNGTGGGTGPAITWGPTFPKNNNNFGVHYQVATVVALINAGYTVIQPAARRQIPCDQANCPYAWDTNFGAWATSPDKTFMNAIVTQLQPSSVTFGAIDINHVYATGISSGGYMTSRVANEYSGGLNPNGTVVDTNKPFRAVAIQSGSYQDCVGMTCTIPPTLPATHPPTYFLHDLGDNVVPYSTRTDYYNRISSQFGMAFVGFDDFDTFISHQWDNDLTGNTSGQSINLILKWFNDHR